MNLFKSLWQAATLTPTPLPKAPNAPQTLPGFKRNIEASKAALRETDRQPATTDRLVSARNFSKTKQVIRELTHTSPDLSSAVSSTLRVGIPEKFTVVARDLDGKIDAAATGLAHELIRRLTYLGNADGSMGVQQSLQSLSEQLGLELLIEGAACVEIALDKARVPASMNPVAVATLKFYEEENHTRMVQLIGGQEIDLDLPTIIYVSLDQDLLQAYPASYLESAVQPVLADLEFNNDTRRALKRAVLPRLTATIDSEMVRKMTPPAILADATAFSAYKQALIDEVENVVNGLSPEDALVNYDSVTFSFIDGGKDPSTIIAKIQEVINSKLASGAKTLPAVLGHGSSSNASSTEAVLFLKNANVVRVKLNEIYSRALTVAVRVLGMDAYVEFEYEPLDLRPARELEAFKSMEQSRVLELLSIGMISDEEACIRLTGNLPPAGYKPLSGTMFKAGGQQLVTNPASNTSAISQSMTSDAPKSPKSKQKAEAVSETTANQQATAQLLATASQQASDAMTRTDKAVSMLQDMAYVMAKQADKPVNVTVEPAVISLQIDQEKKPPNKKVRVVRDAEGRISSMELDNGGEQ